VTVDGQIVGQINHGLLVLLGVAQGDSPQDAEYLAGKLAELRIFEDDQGKMNRSLEDTGGGMLVVSQFTLLGDCRKGRRPSFVGAADPVTAEQLYERFAQAVAARGVPIATGVFRAHMDVALVNDGPVTLLVESRR
jgi:D-tyrosyl-tRNA(Tyr) deacylase